MAQAIAKPSAEAAGKDASETWDRIVARLATEDPATDLNTAQEACGRYAVDRGRLALVVRHPDGNWLIDSPKFVAPLVRRLESLGGVGHIFLTHRDDVADADRYAAHFHARRIIHRDELSSQPGAEVVLDGAGPWELAPGFLAIPTPGHTKGHCVLLVQDRFLFTGEVLNVLDAKDDDIEYFYTSRLPGEPAEGVDDLHIHPMEPRSWRLAVRVAL